MTNSTFSGNGSGITSGGFSGTLTVTNSTLAANDLGISAFRQLTLANSVVANGDCSGTVADGGHNLDSGTTCGFVAANGSLSNTDPKLDPSGLANNGGPTQTIALLAGSPAINAGDPGVCASPPVNGLDQRGYGRPGVGSTKCSIGAYEYKSSGAPTPTPTATATPIQTPQPSGDGGGGGCAVAQTARDGAVWWLLLPALGLSVMRRRSAVWAVQDAATPVASCARNWVR